VLVRSAGEAETAAAGFGGPVAMKINGAAFSHKTEIGGVELNVATPSAAREVYQTLTERVATAMPGAPADGVIVAPMVRGGVETILGVQVDPVFGPAIMFGLGGVFVVVFQDVAFRLAPIGRDSHSLSARRDRLDGDRPRACRDRGLAPEALAKARERGGGVDRPAGILEGEIAGLPVARHDLRRSDQ
jgi:hypothetical protein